MKRRDFVARSVLGGAALATFGSLGWSGCRSVRSGAARVRLSDGWGFIREDAMQGAQSWDTVSLPHTAKVEAVVTGPPDSETFQWQGVCRYRRILRLDAAQAAGTVLLHFEGAMNNAVVWLDGAEIGGHRGGFLPFVVDLTGIVTAGVEHELEVVLDNRDDPVTGPKPLRDLDFNMYGGLYRHVHLVTKDLLHISDPLLEKLPGGGGVFVTYPEATAERARLRVQTHVRNRGAQPRTFSVEHVLTDQAGVRITTGVSTETTLEAGDHEHLTLELEVENPELWDVDHPFLYNLTSTILEAGGAIDAEQTRVGIRRIEIDASGFRINGTQRFLRGTNRHQEYPHVGYAISDAAQYRDAWLIKKAGFDYIRLSHYPHSNSFMDACDELGLVVMDCIPGWQYFNYDDPRFTEIQLENCRQMMRRDRNHPCVILWEVSLNETWMPDEFVEQTKEAAAEEYPGDQCYTCGWQGSYDVFIQARQHGGCRGVTDRACVVSEYGDWEYYAMNAGLNQSSFDDLAPDEANSRQLRWHGERALLQQASNFQEAHNDNLATIAFADGLWVMFDYNRGYAPDIESSGCADLFRLPKFSYQFFSSQRGASGPDDAVVFIASYWTPESNSSVRVFSNCDEVEIRLNGQSVGRSEGDTDRMTTQLAHAPFTFDTAFEPGELEAIGYLAGQEVARHAVRTPGPAVELRLDWAENGREFASDGRDEAFVRASLVDSAGTLVTGAWENVSFGTRGNAEILGRRTISSEAGIASALVQGMRDASVYAVSVVESEGGWAVLAASSAANGDATPYSVHATTDGSAPDADSPLYESTIPGGMMVRAALVVDGQVLVGVASNEPKTRLQGSVGPDSYGEFHY